MARAVFDGQVIAESDDVRVVEGMTYFPLDSVRHDLLIESPVTSRCFWKGVARYWHVQGQDDIAQNAAFAYERPWPLARKLVTGRIAFWRGVQVTRD
jgi:uncharacterized protein (DUF427 family)